MLGRFSIFLVKKECTLGMSVYPVLFFFLKLCDSCNLLTQEFKVFLSSPFNHVSKGSYGLLIFGQRAHITVLVMSIAVEQIGLMFQMLFTIRKMYRRALNTSCYAGLCQIIQDSCQNWLWKKSIYHRKISQNVGSGHPPTPLYLPGIFSCFS